MKFLGFEIKRAGSMSPPDNRGGWWPLIREPFAGAWQRNMEIKQEDMLAYHAVFACVTLIASDISKIGLALFAKDSDGIWNPRETAELTKLLDKPNTYQTRQQFIESWLISKLSRGNAYILKERRAGKIVALHVLHPDRTTPLITESGGVYYQLNADRLAKVTDLTPVVSDDEIIHDRFNCLYHPLVGISPLYAAAIPILQGKNIQLNSATFFGNNSNPGGILTAPGHISDETATRMKQHWDANYSGSNAGKVAVLGDGLKYEQMAVTATDAQLIEQLKYTAEVVCSVFHVPPYKIGVGTAPSYNNIQALNGEYYSQCLQALIKGIQTCLNVGLDTSAQEGFRFDLDALLMMDSKTQIDVMKEAVASAISTPNEARLRLNKKPITGGDSAYLQQQNFSLQALAKRDAQENPFDTSGGGSTDPETEPEDITERALHAFIQKGQLACLT